MDRNGCLSSIWMFIRKWFPFDFLVQENPSLSNALINAAGLRTGSLTYSYHYLDPFQPNYLRIFRVEFLFLFL